MNSIFFIRKRFTLPIELAQDAEQYALVDNRTFSELVCEALRQHIKRYPRTQKNGHGITEKALIDRIVVLEKIVAQRYPQVPCEPPHREVTGTGRGTNAE